jgi:hypothetical protein
MKLEPRPALHGAVGGTYSGSLTTIYWGIPKAPRRNKLRIATTTCFPGWVGIGEVLKDINDLVAHRFIL